MKMISVFISLKQEASVKLIFQYSKNIKTGLFGTTFQELIKFKSGNLFLGHPAEKTDASKFQFFEIQVLVFNYRRISISQTFENLGFVRLKGEWTY